MGRAPVRAEIHTDDIKIEQKSEIIDGADRAPEIVRAEQVDADKEQLAKLAFNEEPVTIRIEPSTEKNAATHIYCAVNGIGCEVLINGQWIQMLYVPVGQMLTIKRKYIEVLARAKSDQITTRHDDVGAEFIDNRVVRVTSAVCAFSVIEDKNPKGAAWLTELRRRNF